MHCARDDDPTRKAMRSELFASQFQVLPMSAAECHHRHAAPPFICLRLMAMDSVSQTTLPDIKSEYSKRFDGRRHVEC